MSGRAFICSLDGEPVVASHSISLWFFQNFLRQGGQLYLGIFSACRFLTWTHSWWYHLSQWSHWIRSMGSVEGCMQAVAAHASLSAGSVDMLSLSVRTSGSSTVLGKILSSLSSIGCGGRQPYYPWCRLSWLDTLFDAGQRIWHVEGKILKSKTHRASLPVSFALLKSQQRAC